jgi:hypothetical protein
MNPSKQLLIGIFIGILIGITIFYSFTQFSTLNSLQTQNKNLQSQINQLQSQNALLNANNSALWNQIQQLQDVATGKSGKAIQIQSASYNPSSDIFTIYVQNIGDSDVQFATSDVLLINGAAATGITGVPAVLAKGSTATITGSATTLDSGSQSVTIKVTAVDGTFSQITKQFTISEQLHQVVATPTPTQTFSTDRTGKAIQIQSVNYNPADKVFTVYVQNVGDSDVQFGGSASVYINNVSANQVVTSGLSGTVLTTGSTATFAAKAPGLTNGVQSIPIKVITVDGSFSQITQQFTIG